MQLRFLEYFVALSREKHFARAAAACNVAQPTLSAGIVALEQLLGGKRLVVRDRRFVDLTPEGRAMLPWAMQMIADHEGMRLAVEGQAGPLSGELRLGVIPAAMPASGSVVRALRTAHPQLTVNIRSMTSRQIQRALAEFELDAGLTYLAHEPPSHVRSVALYAERYLFATRIDAAFGRHDAVRWAEVAEQPLCLLHPGMQNRRILDAQLASLGLDAAPRATADSYVTLIAMVRDAGLSTILPDSYAGFLPGEVRLIDFVDPAPSNRIGLVILDREPQSPLSLAALTAVQRLSNCESIAIV